MLVEEASADGVRGAKASGAGTAWDSAAACGAAAWLWRSVWFWRVFPWLSALAIIGTSTVLTLLFGTSVYEDCPQAIGTSSGTPRGWAWTVLLALLLTWLLVEPIFILLSNNRTRVRSIACTLLSPLVHMYHLLNECECCTNCQTSFVDV